MGDTAGWRFYDEQVRYLMAGDADGLIDNHYNEDAELVTFDFVVKGRDALRQHFGRYLQSLGAFELKSTDKFRETEDTIFWEATIATDLGEARAYDALVMRNGKVSHHFHGAK